MREFFKQCLEDLESLTGSRQLYFLESDLENGAKKIKVCIDGMVLASQDYPYIPEEAQQKIIREQMVKDQNYESLNSRQIHKWLSMFKEKYWSVSEHATREPETKPADPEVADKYLNQMKEIIGKIGHPEVVNGMKEIRERHGLGTATSVHNPRPEWIVGDECPECNGKKFDGDKFCGICEGTGKINRAVVNAVSQEEADKAFQSFKQQSA